MTAVQQAGKQGKVLVYSFDATPDIVAALKSGTVAALLAQAPRKLGAEAVQDLVTALKAGKSGAALKPASPQSSSVPTLVLTKDNVNSAAAGDYLYKSTCD
ncbi:substrate-binding domain-containing protein [Streptomyces prunicolor]|uniref:Substrate-binding domain-containing protein n=1 Tax=Streptomyces prunicolor TaxID=67348 RepID=A0ABU4FDD6_9ACTN|nr:substrate-binding domain-containing protein [Streptomyces prunicolor]MCX5240397.1 substrate-binding domain-containing protein [Streptomyces prunicolor]MDV7218048.1 substrate-binding domain-containing protein [Streptomyces prunicolor]